MKKIKLVSSVLVGFLLLTFLYSCKKSSPDDRTPDNNNYYVRFKINGVQQNLTYLAAISYDHYVSPVELYGCYGISSSPSGSHAVYLTLWNTTAFASNMTLDESAFVMGDIPKVTFRYTTNTSPRDYVSAAYFDLHPTLVKNFTVKITAFDTKSVKGIFSGTLYPEKSNGEPDIINKVEITDGEFNFKRN